MISLFKKIKANKVFLSLLSLTLLISFLLGLATCNKEIINTREQLEVYSEEVQDAPQELSQDFFENEEGRQTDKTVKYGESYNSVDELASYLHKFGELPPNYLTKDEAKDLGWIAPEGNLNEVAPGMSIGGDKFGNREGLLPIKKGRQYYECDVDYESGWRNAKRIVYSNDGLIFFTDDHYASFKQLY